MRLMTKIRAINLTRTLRHQLSFDENKGTDKAITWILGALDSRVFAAIKDRATGIPMSALNGGDGTATLNINQTNFDIVLFGLKGFENFQYEDGKQVEYKTAHTNLGGKTYLTADPDLISMIPSDVIDELATEIMEMNSLKEDERKN
jgi:hypothetical protein